MKGLGWEMKGAESQVITDEQAHQVCITRHSFSG